MPLTVLPMLGPISVSESLVAIITICVVYLLMRLMRTKIPEGLQKLPGPKPLPIIGNVLEVGTNPHLSLTAMSKCYGPVFQIQIGMRPVVVLSGNDVIRQALLKQGEEFSGRPDLYSSRFISDGKSLAFSSDQVGVWRARRKLALSALRTFSTVQGESSEYSCALEEHISKEGLYLIERLHSVMKTDGSFDPFRHIVVSVANVICGICFGRRYSHDDDELVSLVNLSDEFGKIVGSGNPADFIPFLRILPSTTMKKFLAINDRFSKLMKKIVNEHYNTFDKVGALRRDYQKAFSFTIHVAHQMWILFQNNIRDITDSLIDHCEDRKLDENSNVQVSDEKIVGIVNDLFGAGECVKTKSFSIFNLCMIY